ncbi:MAG: hypothetical protein EGR21_08980 [Faecalibacterium prausnitzii]|nr:hypothetical protein [Faecalibacterium prausnitzii]
MYRWWTDDFKTILNGLRCALTIFRGKIFEFCVLSGLRAAQNAFSQEEPQRKAASITKIADFPDWPFHGWIFAKNRIFPLDRSGSFWYQ